MKILGVSYVVPGAPTDAVRRDLRAIRDDLHCTTVMLIGLDHLIATARVALELGLDVYVRPEFSNMSRRAVLSLLAPLSAEAERLHGEYPGRVTLLVGSEFSLTTSGMLPGPHLYVRLQVLIRPRLRRRFDRRITRKLNALLRMAVRVARSNFRGPVTYAAGYWESVDWTPFDVVGVNLYRIGADHAAYEARLRALVAGGKDVVVTEFGCGAFVGADLRGPGSFLAVNWFAVPPQLKPGHTRDEETQASYLTDLIDVYARYGVHGCFAYTFASPDFPHRAEPEYDLDMAGFGLVATTPDDPTSWYPKQSFHAVAARYAALRERPQG